MRLCVTIENRFKRTPDGRVWTIAQSPYDFWLRYLNVFDEVLVVARVQDVPSVPSEWLQSDGNGVSFAAIPFYIGPWQYLKQIHAVRQAIIEAVMPKDAVILRVPSNIANCLYSLLVRTGHPYALEVVGDPYDAFSPSSVKHPLRPFFRWWFSHQLRQQCLRAHAVSYVTEKALQKRYPSQTHSSISDMSLSRFLLNNNSPFDSLERLETFFSSIKINSVDFNESNFTKQSSKPKNHTYKIIFVGAIEQMYKAPDVLIDAFARCVQQGYNLELVIIGDGKHRQELENRARARGIAERVLFLGMLPAGDAVRNELDKADLFVLPSRQEGLPRAMIEAMARGLPCIGSTVGGIPELLPPEDMVPPGDVDALARKICEVLSNPERMVRMAARNLEKAKEYRDDILQQKRNQFYLHLRERTEEWLKSKR